MERKAPFAAQLSALLATDEGGPTPDVVEHVPNGDECSGAGHWGDEQRMGTLSFSTTRDAFVVRWPIYRRCVVIIIDRHNTRNSTVSYRGPPVMTTTTSKTCSDGTPEQRQTTLSPSRPEYRTARSKDGCLTCK